MINKLPPCPDCRGECVLEDFGRYPEASVIKCRGCDYAVRATTKAQAIAHHERLAGRCRWRRKEEIEHTSEVWWQVGCTEKHLTSWKYGHPGYCELCGKKVEEIRR